VELVIVAQRPGRREAQFGAGEPDKLILTAGEWRVGLSCSVLLARRVTDSQRDGLARRQGGKLGGQINRRALMSVCGAMIASGRFARAVCRICGEKLGQNGGEEWGSRQRAHTERTVSPKFAVLSLAHFRREARAPNLAQRGSSAAKSACLRECSSLLALRLLLTGPLQTVSGECCGLARGLIARPD